jgi:Tfp pilus assembly protein PilX
MRTNNFNWHNIHRQQGAVSLLISMVLLTVITFVSVYTSKTVLLEQKISANELRGRIAFEAAESGVESAIAAINNGWTRDANMVVLPNEVYDTDGNLTNGGETNSNTLVNGSRVTVTLSDASSGDLIATRIVAQGWSDDSSATRTINVISAFVSPLPNTPDVPLSTRGRVVISGSATVHNPEGHSTIWSGGDVDFGSNNTTSTTIADPSASGYPDCLGSASTPCSMVRSSDRYTAGLDVIEHDTSLSNLTTDEFFQNTFGMSMLRYQTEQVTVDVLPANINNLTTASPPGASLGANEVIWVEGNTAFNNLTVGCTTSLSGSNVCSAANTKPSILIINGNLNVSGNIHIYGLLYVTGIMTGSGNLTTVGAVMMQGSNSAMTGSVDITYNSAVLRSLADNTDSAGGGGSWRDF